MKTVFFSYSRTDSEFVLKLAEDLRDAGIELLWLDQFDIKLGNRWDSSIEAALKSSSHVIAVLSPASVSSNNVMDEVNFALGNNKTIIPVLLTECTIPFRLTRLQYVDFTGEYQVGLNRLLDYLKETMNADEESLSMPAEEKPNPAEKKEIPHSEKNSGSTKADKNDVETEKQPKTNASMNKPPKKNHLKKYLAFVGSTLLLFIALVIYLKISPDDPIEKLEANNDTIAPIKSQAIGKSGWIYIGKFEKNSKEWNNSTILKFKNKNISKNDTITLKKSVIFNNSYPSPPRYEKALKRIFPFTLDSGTVAKVLNVKDNIGWRNFTWAEVTILSQNPVE